MERILNVIDCGNGKKIKIILVDNKEEKAPYEDKF